MTPERQREVGRTYHGERDQTGVKSHLPTNAATSIESRSTTTAIVRRRWEVVGGFMFTHSSPEGCASFAWATVPE
jgi:hypothetical protein